MGVASILLGVGVGLFSGGAFWKLGEDIWTRHIAKYVFDHSDPYYLGSDLVWNAIPYVLIVCGIFCLVMAGLQHHGSRQAVYE